MMINRLMNLVVRNRAVAKALPQQTAVVAAADGGDSTMYLFDSIVSTQAEAEWFGGVAAETLVPQLRAIKGGTLHLRISSPGGDVFAAQAIVAAIRDCKANVIAHIDGLAASAATVIAMAADTVEMSDGAMFMVHCGWTMAMGNATDMRATAALLDKVDSVIVDQYAKRTGMDPAAVKDMMLAETWMTAQEALDNGFINKVCGPTTKNEWDLSMYAKAPLPAPKAEVPPANETIPETISETIPETISAEQRDYQNRRVRLLIANQQ
ncbi:MAG: serine protease [Phenylobacterium zucineum]|nr:MAG: serine protease [Phenylobacterium zucineum]